MAPQICRNALSSAENTVVAPMINVTMLTTVAQMPCVRCAACMASTTIFAVESPNSSLSCCAMCASAACAPTIQPMTATAMTSSGASEKAL